MDSRAHQNVHISQLIAEPVLLAPVYNGMPFILTTDGSKDAFTASWHKESNLPYLEEKK